MRYHVFTSSGTLTVVRGGVVYAMIVAAGGSPRSHLGIVSVEDDGAGAGGGGGGGLANYLPVVVPESSYQTMIVGQAALKSRGGNSSITCLCPATLTGGGTSGNSQSADSQNSGGSGGGENLLSGTYGGFAGSGNTPSFIPSQGRDGGAQADAGAGGGGGFATAAGGRPAPYNLTNDGGQGLELDLDTVALGSLINNNTFFSSGGGGAGSTAGNSAGIGGNGAGNGSETSYGGNPATDATMYGCGGGGGKTFSSRPTYGYQGIVIIRYPVN